MKCPISQKECNAEKCAFGALDSSEFSCSIKEYLVSLWENQERMNTTLDEINNLLKDIQSNASSTDSNTGYISDTNDKLDEIIKIIKK